MKRNCFSIRFKRVWTCGCLLAMATALAQTTQPGPPPLPPQPTSAAQQPPKKRQLPEVLNQPQIQQPAAQPTAVVQPAQSAVIPSAFKPIPQPSGLPPAQPVQPANVLTNLPEKILAWDADEKTFNAKLEDTAANFTFNLTNVSPAEVVVTAVRTSCGCTVAKVPTLPWKLESGTNGQFEVTVDLRGKRGTLTKSVTMETSKGVKYFFVKINIPEPPAVTDAANMGDRAKNLALAASDRQAVFKNDCAKCHAEPTVGKTGEALYTVACGICHDAEHRATMVTDLKNLKNPTDREYWKRWVTSGKPGSLMPAFAKAEGGPLTDEQIDSLASFLVTKYPSHPATASTTGGAQ